VTPSVREGGFWVQEGGGESGARGREREKRMGGGRRVEGWGGVGEWEVDE